MTSHQTLLEYVQTLSGFDIGLIIVLLLSVGISLYRGATKEILGTVTWVLAAFLAVHFNHWLSIQLAPYIDSPPLRSVIAVIALLVSVLLLGSMLNFILAHLIKHSGLSGIDRLLGVLFGAVRGIALVGLLLFAGHLMQFDESTWWQQSQVVTWFKPIMSWAEKDGKAYVLQYYHQYLELVPKKEPEFTDKVTQFVKDEVAQVKLPKMPSFSKTGSKSSTSTQPLLPSLDSTN